MRTFREIYSILDLEEFLDSSKGTLYCGPSGPKVPEIMVRHFDGYFSNDLVQAFVTITEAVRKWIYDRPDLEKFVTLETLTEVGIDFIYRPFHIYQTSLRIYDNRADRSETPEEIEQMREALKQIVGRPNNEKEYIIEKVLKQSILESANKTYFDWSSHKFCIVELKMTRDDLQAWARLYN
jgi:hypothetical protein